MANENLTQLLSKLAVQSTKDEFAETQKIVLQLLSDPSNEEDYGSIMRAYLASCIKQDKYALAANILVKEKKIDDQYGDQFVLEKLYVFYKLNETEKFQELYEKVVPGTVGSVVEKSEEETLSIRGILHVRAQFCYNNAQYEEAFKLYHYLATHNEKLTDNDIELACNERVPLTVEPFLQSSASLSEVNGESYDLLFNESMILSAKGLYDEALEMLNKARKLAANDGYESDLNAIDLQTSYVYQVMGNNKASQELLDKLISKLEKGSPLALLANMNRKAFYDFSKYKTNLNLVIRELNAEAMTGYNVKQYTQAQWSVISHNLLFLHLFNNDSIQPKKSPLSQTLHKYSETINDVNLEPYKSQAKKLYRKTVKLLEEHTRRQDINAGLFGLVLLTIQLLVVEKQWQNATTLCEHAFSLYSTRKERKQERQYQILNCIYIELLRCLGKKRHLPLPGQYDQESAHSESDMANDLAFLKHLCVNNIGADGKSSGDDFSRISSFTDDNFMKKHSSRDANEIDIQEALKLSQDVDVEALLEAGAAPLKSTEHPDVINISGAGKKKQTVLHLRKQRLKEKRLRKFLENRDTTKTPDPERWLPKRDRSTYRPKKKQTAKQTQGGLTNKRAEQALDISKSAKVSKKGRGKRK